MCESRQGVLPHTQTSHTRTQRNVAVHCCLSVMREGTGNDVLLTRLSLVPRQLEMRGTVVCVTLLPTSAAAVVVASSALLKSNKKSRRHKTGPHTHEMETKVYRWVLRCGEYAGALAQACLPRPDPPLASPVYARDALVSHNNITLLFAGSLARADVK